MNLLVRAVSYARQTAGNVAMIFAMLAPLLVTILAIVVDLGAVSIQRREMQAIADLSAIIGSTDPDNASALVLAVLADNGHTDVQLVEGRIDPAKIDLKKPARILVEVVPGQYIPDTEKKPVERFVEGQEPYNAVKVTTAQAGRFFFMSGMVDPPVIKTSGTAHATGEAAFSVGSRLVRIEGGVLNALLDSLIGSHLSLSVMDYNALLTGEVSLLGTMDALATDLDLTAASYDEVLDSRISVAQLALAARQSGTVSVSTRSALQKIASDPASDHKFVRLRDAIDLGSAGRYGPATRDQIPELMVKPMEFITAALTAANGEHQVTLDLGVSVPGLLKTTVDLKIGERPQHSPWLRLSGPNKIVSTVQTRLKISTEVKGLSLLAGLTVKLPLYVEVAAADAQLSAVACPAGQTEKSTVHIDVQPAVGEIFIGEVSPAKFAKLGAKLDVKSAKIVDSKLLAISAKADVRIGNRSSSSLTFSYSDIMGGKIKTVSTRDYTNSLVASVLEETDLSIQAGLLNLGTPKLIEGALVSTLTPALEPLDTLLFNLLSALGIHLGEADVRVHGVMCQRPVLVQ